MNRACAISISLAVCASVTACALVPRERTSLTDPTLPRKSTTPLYRDIAQLFTSVSSRFGICQGASCPSPTPKTLAYADPPPIASSNTPAASSADPLTPLPQPSLRPVVFESAPAQKPPAPIVLSRVVLSFPTASSYLTPAMQKRLDDSLPSSRGAIKVVIRGRTDDIGPPQLNDKLAYLRAIAVRNHLVSRKAATDEQLEIDSKGSCCYVIANTDEKCRSMNRRVEVEFVSQG